MIVNALYVEAAYLLSAFFILCLMIPVPTRHPAQTGENIAAFFGIKLFLQCFVGSYASFLLSPVIHLWIPALLVVGTAIPVWAQRQHRPLFAGLFLFPYERNDRAFLALFIAALAALTLISLRLVDETDSHHHMNYIVDWLRGNASAVPFTYANASPVEWVRSYVFFWEAGNIPLLAVAPDDRLLWVNQVEALVLFTSLLLSIMREAGIRFPIRLALAFHALLIYSFWSSGTGGIGTIKNDIPMHCGILFILLGFLRRGKGKDDVLSILCFLFGAAFATIKFSGPPTLAALTILGFIFLPRAALLARSWRNPVALMAIGFGGSTFICYLRNTLVDGNPLYPVQITLFGHAWPGLFQLAHSSILSHGREKNLWLYLVGANHHYPAGFLCWLAPACGIYVLLSCAWRKLYARAPSDPLIGYFAAVTLVLFFLFISSYWSAGHPGDNLSYIEAQNTYRYALSWFGLSALVLYLAWREKVKEKYQWVFLALLAVDGVIRLSGIVGMEWAHHYDFYEAAQTFQRLVFFLIALAILWQLARIYPALRAAVPFVALPLCLLTGIDQVGQSRDHFMEHYPGLSPFFAEMPPQNIASLTSVDGILSYRLNQRDYPIVGAHFQHRIQRLSLPELVKNLKETNVPPDFITFMSTHHDPFTGEEITTVNAALPGYALIEPQSHYAIWARLAGNAAPLPTRIQGVGTEGNLGLEFAEACQAPGLEKERLYFAGGRLLTAACRSVQPVLQPKDFTAPLLDADNKPLPDISFALKNGHAFIEIPADKIPETARFPAHPGIAGDGWAVWTDGIKTQPGIPQDGVMSYESESDPSVLDLSFHPRSNPDTHAADSLSLILRIKAQGCAPDINLASNDYAWSKIHERRALANWRVPEGQTDTYIASASLTGSSPLNSLSIDILPLKSGCRMEVSAEILPDTLLPATSLIDVRESFLTPMSAAIAP